MLPFLWNNLHVRFVYLRYAFLLAAAAVLSITLLPVSSRIHRIYSDADIFRSTKAITVQYSPVWNNGCSAVDSRKMSSAVDVRRNDNL